MPLNWTVAADAGGGLEFFGGEQGLDIQLSINARIQLRFNNYNGFGTAFLSGITIPVGTGIASLGFG